jgi:DNA-binding transcriptional LysR family regulator
MSNDALLPLLPSLIALVETESVTGGAQKLGISQPRMSARLADLRRLLDDPLLVPANRKRGLVATARALALAEAARQSLADLDRAVSSAGFDPATAERTFTIMANDNAAVMVGARLVVAIRKAAGPKLRIAFLAYDAARLADLEKGAIDLALGSPRQFEAMPMLITRTVIRDSFATAMRATADEKPIDIDDFCARDHILVSGQGGGFDGVVDSALAKVGRQRRVSVSVQSYLVAIELAASSNLLATLPRALLSHRRHALSLSDTPIPLGPFSLAAAWHPRVSTDPAHRWLRDQLFAPAMAAEDN